jgi:chromate transport protein ChrA
LEIIKNINKGIMFLLEVCMLIALSYWGFHAHIGLPAYVYGITTPVLAAILWSVFAAPKSKRRLRMPYRAFFSFAIFCIAAILLYQTGLTNYAIVFIAIAFVCEILAYSFED